MSADDLARAREHMVRHQLQGRDITDPAVLAALGRVPRHEFVPPHLRHRAYADGALPSTHGQTISQPYMVALMTQLLAVTPGATVLEIGTGTGYQTAVLLELGAVVHTIEREPALSASAQAQLTALGYTRQVSFHVGDGTLGLPAAAPFDRILVTAGAPHVPAAFRRQLADHGRLVIPIGNREFHQQLMVYARHGERWDETASTACVFVPLVGADGWTH
jgi:protein-L-isoaspartate(D-aspartate) O-methyltransferase